MEPKTIYRWYRLTKNGWEATCWKSQHKDFSDWDENKHLVYIFDRGDKKSKLVRELTTFTEVEK
jgi:hypothetical protein